jgi:hypothetical protein
MCALFGLFLAIHYDAPWYVWIIGFLCVMADKN